MRATSVLSFGLLLVLAAPGCEPQHERMGSLRRIETSPGSDPGAEPRTAATEREIDRAGAVRPEGGPEAVQPRRSSDVLATPALREGPIPE